MAFCGVPSCARAPRILIDGSLPARIELEPVTAIVSLTKAGHPGNAASVIDAASYSVVTRDPAGTVIAPAPGCHGPRPCVSSGASRLPTMAGWTVTPESAPLAGTRLTMSPPAFGS